LAEGRRALGKASLRTSPVIVGAVIVGSALNTTTLFNVTVRGTGVQTMFILSTVVDTQTNLDIAVKLVSEGAT